MKKNTNIVVFITGGSSGIGLSLAKVFASAGANIVIFARNEKKLKTARDEIYSKVISASQAISHMALDVSVYNDVKNKMKKAVEYFGTPDILINCAGAAYPDYFENITYEQFDETIKTNLYGNWNVVHTLVPFMKAHGGHIVNFSSVAGFVGVFGYTDYAASKFGIVGFSETLKSELKRYNIGVSIVFPPDTDTPGFQNENKRKPPETKAVSGGAKLMHPDDVALKVYKGIMKKKSVIIPNIESTLVYFLKRLFPKVLDLIMESSIKKAQAKF